ncbi:hypothetical protein [Paenibacillus dendritiformis]|uniref:hypothetical protein n=1 Tax=Paenibacillus dendritiformis TaxID=130049 RepID=UPI001BCE28D4|nr:hypothetical protein [Paenibacillus dendritiformis]
MELTKYSLEAEAPQTSLLMGVVCGFLRFKNQLEDDSYEVLLILFPQGGSTV